MTPKRTKDIGNEKKQPDHPSSVEPEELDAIRHISDSRAGSLSPEVKSSSSKDPSQQLDALRIYVHPPEGSAQTQATSTMKVDKGPKRPGQDMEQGTKHLLPRQRIPSFVKGEGMLVPPLKAQIAHVLHPKERSLRP